MSLLISEVATMYDYRRGESVLGAFLLGGIVGAVLGLLFAPKSGKENREFIAAKAKEYWGEGLELYEAGKEKATEVYTSSKEKATETTEELRERLEAARSRLREQVESVSKEAKEKVVEVVPTAKETVHKVGEAVKSGVATAESKAEELLDLVAEKAAEAPEEPEAPGADAPALS